MVDVSFGEVWLEVGALEKAEEEFVDELQVRPRGLQGGLVLFRVVFGAHRIRGRRQRAKHVDAHLHTYTGIALYGMGEGEG